ncbi:MAG TPA: hypothetical protein VL652_17395 [Kutzneria sp.]|nr:hypothetical protein [Kutzneria sp.]
MNEQDLREALRDAMTEAVPPRPVTADAALTKAQRALRTRRANIAGLGVGVAVVALVAGAFTVPGPRTLLGTAAGPKTTPAPTSSISHGDRTQYKGPENDKSVRLLDALEGVLPYPIQRATAEQTKGAQFDLRRHQAQVEDWNKNTWSYQAVEPVAPASSTAPGVGELIVEVHGPGNDIPTDPCAMARDFWRIGGDCEETQVVGKRIGLVQHTAAGRIDSLAAYRYPDGTVVYLAQSASVFASGTAALSKPPLTDAQLVNLVLTPGFKVTP